MDNPGSLKSGSAQLNTVRYDLEAAAISTLGLTDVRVFRHFPFS